jgi:DNA-binding NarL/FixJ family response regulator
MRTGYAEPISPLSNLSDREHVVLAAMADGLSNNGIANRFHLSLKTVETVSRSVFQKLGLVEGSRVENRRVKAVVMFLEHTSVGG